MKNEIITVIVEKLIFEGKGLARLDDGRVVFVIGDVLPDEKVEVEVFKVKKDYLEARLVKRLSESDKRISAKCEYFGKCGGCNYQSLSYENQLSVKSAIFEETVQKILKNIDYSINPIIASELQWQYRHKIELTFIENEDKSWDLGYYQKGSWHSVIDVKNCDLFDEKIIELLPIVRKWVEKNKLQSFNHKKFHGLLRNVIFRKAHYTDEWLVGIVTTDEKLEKDTLLELKDLLATQINVQSFWHRVIKIKREKGERWKDSLLWGREFIVEKILGLDFEVRFADFFQNNITQAEKMIQTVISEIKKTDSYQHILDLYCGIGTFTLPLAKEFSQSTITGIEIVQSAIDSAQQNAQKNDLDHINFICEDVGKIINETLAEKNFDVILVDPPRAGLAGSVIESLRNCAAHTILYVSCNPSTFARDLSMLSDDFTIEMIQPFDLFPQTYHIETIGVLKRK